MKKNKFIDDVRVKDPCTKVWDEMIGNDKVRFCEHCAKDVTNISAMTSKEAKRVVRRSGGSICIRYVQHPTTKRPMFAEQLTQITRRAPLMAAGVMSASLSLASLTYAQGGVAITGRRVAKPEPAAARVVECEDVAKVEKKGDAKEVVPVKNETNIEPVNAPPQQSSDESGALVRGTVMDANEAVVAGATVEIISDAKVLMQLTTDGDGSFKFENVPAGTYELAVLSPGFRAYKSTLTVGEDTTSVRKIMLEAGAIMGDMVVVVEYEGELAAAVSRDDIEQARQLISAGANVNRKESNGKTALFAAVENSNLEMIELLLNSGAKVNVRSKEKETALMQIDDDAPPELIRLLVRYGADVNRVSNDGDTVLIRVARYENTELLRALIDAGADLDVQNQDGESALMAAADEDLIENVRMLLVSGAEVNLRDKDGDNAWDFTADDDIERLLESYGVVVDPEDIEEPSGPGDSEPVDN